MSGFELPAGTGDQDVDGDLSEFRATAISLLSHLDGLFAGLAVGPQEIAPDEWLPLVLGDDPDPDAPAFDDPEGAQEAAGGLVLRCNEVADSITDGSYEPILEEGPDGELDGAAWAEGFALAMSLRMDAWEPLFNSKRDRGLLAPILLLREHNDLELDPDDDLARFLEDTAEILPDCLFGIDRFWRRRGRRGGGAPALAAAPKIGRNEPCPCGSGKKFKKCCGA
jgi:uncharacterized protein